MKCRCTEKSQVTHRRNRRGHRKVKKLRHRLLDRLRRRASVGNRQGRACSSSGATQRTNTRCRWCSRGFCFVNRTRWCNTRSSARGIGIFKVAAQNVVLIPAKRTKLCDGGEHHREQARKATNQKRRVTSRNAKQRRHLFYRHLLRSRAAVSVEALPWGGVRDVRGPPRARPRLQRLPGWHPEAR